MSYTPVELRHVKVGRSLFGYNRATVEQLIEEVAQSFEATWRERGELTDKVETLEKQIDELRGREHPQSMPRATSASGHAVRPRRSCRRRISRPARSGARPRPSASGSSSSRSASRGCSGLRWG
jgi:cell division septum initiation protein DivIVA